MRILLSDNGLHLRFAPLTLTRPVGNLRIGILTNDERWKQFVPDAEIFFETESYLQNKFQGTDKWDVKINANVIPNQELVDQIQSLKKNTRLVINGSASGAYYLNKLSYYPASTTAAQLQALTS